MCKFLHLVACLDNADGISARCAAAITIGSPDPTGRAWHVCNDPKHVYPACSWGELHGRLVPRRGAGPELRSSGREIDEYLMRLLHAGSTDASQDIKFHHLVRLHPF